MAAALTASAAALPGARCDAQASTCGMRSQTSRWLPCAHCTLTPSPRPATLTPSLGQYENLTDAARTRTALRDVKRFIGLDAKLPHQDLGLHNSRKSVSPAARCVLASVGRHAAVGRHPGRKLPSTGSCVHAWHQHTLRVTPGMRTPPPSPPPPPTPTLPTSPPCWPIPGMRASTPPHPTSPPAGLQDRGWPMNRSEYERLVELARRDAQR